MLYWNQKKEQPSTRGWPLQEIELPPCNCQVYKGGFSMYDYLQNVNTNVSNARRKRPKVIKSIKSNWFFIGITPILKRMRSSHPATRLLHVFHHNIFGFFFQSFLHEISVFIPYPYYFYPHTIFNQIYPFSCLYYRHFRLFPFSLSPIRCRCSSVNCLGGEILIHEVGIWA